MGSLLESYISEHGCRSGRLSRTSAPASSRLAAPARLPCAIFMRSLSTSIGAALAQSNSISRLILIVVCSLWRLDCPSCPSCRNIRSSPQTTGSNVWRRPARAPEARLCHATHCHVLMCHVFLCFPFSRFRYRRLVPHRCYVGVQCCLVLLVVGPCARCEPRCWGLAAAIGTNSLLACDDAVGGALSWACPWRMRSCRLVSPCCWSDAVHARSRAAQARWRCCMCRSAAAVALAQRVRACPHSLRLAPRRPRPCSQASSLSQRPQHALTARRRLLSSRAATRCVQDVRDLLVPAASH
jgi:hypothetical protein